MLSDDLSRDSNWWQKSLVLPIGNPNVEIHSVIKVKANVSVDISCIRMYIGHRDKLSMYRYCRTEVSVPLANGSANINININVVEKLVGLSKIN